MEKNKILEFYKKMLLIREFENRILKLFSEGKIHGTTHTCIGQEANAVGVLDHVSCHDLVVSHHRCHGHFLAFTGDAAGLFAEMIGSTEGVCGGRGGSQHLCSKNFYTNGVQGGILPLATGLAMAQKYLKAENIVTVFMGDGTLGQGVVYESLNIASLFSLPLLIVLENNQYAQSTKVEEHLAGSIPERFRAFGIEAVEISTFDVIDIWGAAQQAYDYVRKNKRPFGLISHTYRYASHSKSDDGRDTVEIERWKKKDCLQAAERFLEPEDIKAVKDAVNRQLDKAQEQALSGQKNGNTR